MSALILVIPRIAVKWYALGLSLGVADHNLDNIKHSPNNGPEECCRMMLQKWRNGYGCVPITWDGLLPVVQKMVGDDASSFIKKEILQWEEEEGKPLAKKPCKSEYPCCHCCQL